MSTYSVYNIHIDNNLSFTPGPTAGNVLAIDADGNTSWVPQTGGSGGSQTLAQTLALGNDVGGNSIVATSGPIALSNPNNNSYISILGTESNQIILSQGLEGTSGRANIILDGGSQTIPTDSSISMAAEHLQINASFRPPGGFPETLSSITMASQSISMVSAGIYINGITSSLLATDVNGRIIGTSSGGGSGTSGTSGSSGVNGQNGQSSSYFLYKANANDYADNPGHGYILWDNATQNDATAIHINHLTSDNIDVDIFLGLIRQGSNLTIQHQTNSSEYQVWDVSAAPTLVSGANNYWTIPVVLMDSTATFNNNTNVFVALSADSGTSGTSGTSGAVGPTGPSANPFGSVGITIDGGGSVITTGTKGYVSVPYSGTITSWVIMSDQTGSIVIDVWKDTFATFPPSVADTIAGSEKPTLSSARINQDTTLSTWTTSVSAGDIIAFNVDSASTLTRVNLAINITKS